MPLSIRFKDYGDAPAHSSTRRGLIICCLLVCLGLLISGRDVAIAQETPSKADSANNSDVDFFERHVRPVFVEHCYECHSVMAQENGQLEAGLRLDSASGWTEGGDSGPAVIAGNPDGSLLIKAMRYDDNVTGMPPTRKLDEDVVAKLAQWVSRGAQAGPDALRATPHSDGSANETPQRSSPSNRWQMHWAFQPPQRAEVNFTTRHDRSRRSQNRIDAILRRHLDAQGLNPNPIASPRALFRRLAYDLTGLPPQLRETTAGDERSSTWLSSEYRATVDRLLASPRFGERWGRYWLDVARFADTKGYVFRESRDYPDADKYRDWVIQSFNDDRPYDEFISYQLAADQLVGDHVHDLAAMGFLTLGRRFLNNQQDIIDDRIDVTTRGLMGLTVSCARCHDHKYDPIPTADYYSLYGVFASSREPKERRSPLQLVDAKTPTEPVVFLRGKPGRRGPKVPRQFLLAVSGPSRQPFQIGSGRLEMAREIASAKNPLTARVWVNRVWQKLMGSYLVATPSDFGTRSDRPILLDLLDDLAVGLMDNDWSLKWLVREIVTSHAYQQSAAVADAGQRLDPENQLYWRANRRRLDFEAMRDTMLAVSEQLDSRRIGGPSSDIAGSAKRRAIYAHIDRQNFPAIFRTFDVAAPDNHSPKRFETLVPQQALFLLNNPFVLKISQQLVEAVEADCAHSDPAPNLSDIKAIRLYERCLRRRPTPTELARASRFITQDNQARNERDAWSQLAQALLISNEFLYLD